MTRVLLATWIAALACAGCSTTAPVADAAAPAVVEINEARARALALARYRELFGDLYMRSNETNEYVRFPQLEESELNDVHAEGDTWVVRADPPAGWYVHARVAKSGAWVEVTRAGFSAY